jgi:hypothetical protein
VKNKQAHKKQLKIRKLKAFYTLLKDTATKVSKAFDLLNKNVLLSNNNFTKMKIKFIVICMALSLMSKAQKVEGVVIKYQPCNGFAISKPLSEMPVAKEIDMEDSEKEEIKIRRKPHQKYKKPMQFVVDPVAQSNMGTKALSSPIVNWQGTTGNADPPDPTGAAGTSNFVQAVNLLYSVYDKTGTLLTGPLSLSSLWTGSTDDGDPIVLYDKYADRWFIQQFNGADKILVAISTSSNPSGAYYTYTFVVDPGNFPDYPKFSIWADGYYCTANLNSPVKLAVFDRTKMLAGNPSAGMISLITPSVSNNGFFSALPADADGVLPPYGTPCPLFIYEDDTWSVGGIDQIHIFKFTTDWITPSNSTLILDQNLPTTPFNVSFTATWDDVSQPGTAQKLDAISDVFMYRAQYRRWVGYNSVVLNNAVIVDTTTKQVGIRWYELRQNTSTNVWSIYQEGTYAPDLHNRWMASIAMDDNGSIAMAYAVSSGTVYPSLRYTGRNASDPLGLMTYTETTAIAGTTSQTGFNRYGDYSQTSLDPDGITFWHTGEYILSGAKTRIFSWQIPNVTTGLTDLTVKPDLLVFQNENNLNIKGVRLPNDNEMQVDIFDVMGKLIVGKKITPNNNSLETTFDVSCFAKATYLVRIGNEKFQKVVKVVIN